MTEVDELEQVPASRGAALQVVQLVDDPKAGSAEVAAAVAVDPALTARILQVANSAYYGLSGRVRTTSFAVTVVGFQTVRSLAALAAAGISRDDRLPRGFWQRSAGGAAAGSLLAGRAGASAPDAFCVGMLHDLGSVLLWRRDPDRHERLSRRTDVPVTQLEQEAFGTTHAALAAELLEGWSVPLDLCAAIGRHHEAPSASAAPLRKALQGGLALCAVADLRAGPADLAALQLLGVTDAELPDLASQASEARQQLVAVLSA